MTDILLEFRRLSELGVLYPEAIRRSSLPMLLLILAAEGWLVAGSLWNRLGETPLPTPTIAEETAGLPTSADGGTGTLSSSPERAPAAQLLNPRDAVTAFLSTPGSEEEKGWIRSIMRVYLEEFRGDYLARVGHTTGAPFVQPVGPPTAEQEIDALAHFIRDHGERMLKAFRDGRSKLKAPVDARSRARVASISGATFAGVSIDGAATC